MWLDVARCGCSEIHTGIASPKGAQNMILQLRATCHGLPEADAPPQKKKEKRKKGPGTHRSPLHRLMSSWSSECFMVQDAVCGSISVSKTACLACADGRALIIIIIIIIMIIIICADGRSRAPSCPSRQRLPKVRWHAPTGCLYAFLHACPMSKKKGRVRVVLLVLLDAFLALLLQLHRNILPHPRRITCARRSMRVCARKAMHVRVCVRKAMHVRVCAEGRVCAGARGVCVHMYMQKDGRNGMSACGRACMLARARACMHAAELVCMRQSRRACGRARGRSGTCV